ncbi:MAG TPA: N-acetylneuraminate synthase family protein [Myxococcota bacterium]|jgi:N-acetylneuraminate synthase|nr:N-acetylneuraminate synthase family protein [Myxococcota bacterium]
MADSVAFVAEVSSNHQRDLARCLAFVDRAAEIGCQAVKFQLFRVARLFAPEILARSETHRRRERWELPVEYLAPIAERARARGLRFSCTPFDLDAVTQLEPYVDFYKIASYELLWLPLLEACARTGKPVVLSTGMATLEEVAVALDALVVAGAAEVTLLHCVSGYPTPPEQANLAALGTLRALGGRHPGLRLGVGWSDHSVSPGVIHRAVHRHGAELVEFHLDLDGSGDEFRTGHCWLPAAMARVIGDVRAGLAADGDGEKRPADCELADRAWRADPVDGLRPLRATRESFAA